MILLTVGTQFPFDRLVSCVDEWASDHAREPVIAQIGPSSYVPRTLECMAMQAPDEFRRLQQQARLIIAHAGMGSIVTAKELGIPIIIMPRDHARGEHRNDHQHATAERFRGTPGVYVAMNERELATLLLDIDSLKPGEAISDKAPAEFIARLRAFIDGESSPADENFG